MDALETTLRSSESPHLRVGERLRVLVAHREVLANLIRKELKVKYAASVLGAVWSLLNPLVYLAVFTFVTEVLDSNIPNFPVYLLSGLLAWNLFSAAAQSGSRAVIDNANLVKKISFPREILPLSSIGVALVDFVLQTAVLVAVMIVAGYGLSWPELALLPLTVLALIAFTTMLTFLLSAMNVRYRDVGHLLNIALLVWFWVTPIVYASALVQRQFATSATGTNCGDILQLGCRVGEILYWLNPLTPVVEGMHRALYVTVSPEGTQVLYDVSLGWLALVIAGVLAGSLVLLRFTWGYFFARSGDFAEEL
jgi:ABC-2 type transport system permease protein